MTRLSPRIEGYAIVSADGMLANADGVMPDDLKIKGDQDFFNAALDRANLIVHGRNSFEDQPNSPRRKRIVATHRVASLGHDPANDKATLWNPAGTSFEEACHFAGIEDGTIALVGGPDVFGLFLQSFDAFWLSQTHHVRLPGGVPVFRGVPARSPQSILSDNGLLASEVRILDTKHGVCVTAWRNPAKNTFLPGTSPKLERLRFSEGIKVG